MSMLTSKNEVVKVVFLLSKILVVLGLYEGDPCTLEDNSSGICTFLTECDGATELLLSGQTPVKCGFEGTKIIVCCKNKQDTKVTKTITITTTTTVTEFPSTTEKVSKYIDVTTSRTTKNRIPGDISKKKCEEYAQHAYNRVNFELSLIRHRSNVPECAYEKEVLIAGGKKASRYEFPHMALIGYQVGKEVQWFCGGSLISKNYVLTAAHCLKNVEFGDAKFVRIGITNLTDLTDVQHFIVSERIKHPEYAHKRYHDIGLLKLERNADLNPYARPACLFTENNIPTKKGIVTGWGLTEEGEGSDYLLKVVLDFYAQDKCNKTYKSEIGRQNQLGSGILYDIMICAGSSVEIKDSCEGDSGGPLQIYHDDTGDVKCMYDIVGITSFGKLCAIHEDIPGVYTRVSAYIKWIEDTVWPSN